jgi:hypothetical protein
MSSQDVSNLINAVLVVATLVVVAFAWLTVREAKKATAEERNTVAELKNLVQAATDTAASSASTMTAARETADISKAALDAAERYQQLGQLRLINGLVDAIRKEVWDAIASDTWVPGPDWQAEAQDQLMRAIIGSNPALPKCRALATTRGAAEVESATVEAYRELGDVFRSLGVEGG